MLHYILDDKRVYCGEYNVPINQQTSSPQEVTCSKCMYILLVIHPEAEPFWHKKYQELIEALKLVQCHLMFVDRANEYVNKAWILIEDTLAENKEHKRLI